MIIGRGDCDTIRTVTMDEEKGPGRQKMEADGMES